METQERGQQPKPPGETPRRTWEAPGIAWEEDFTPYAFSTCSKMPGQGGACNTGMRSS